jgi:hypothetical protein
MEVQLHALILASDGGDVSALRLGRFTTVVLQLTNESNGPQSQTWPLKIYVALLGIEPRFFSSFSPQPSHYSNWTILTMRKGYILHNVFL